MVNFFYIFCMIFAADAYTVGVTGLALSKTFTVELETIYFGTLTPLLIGLPG
jgi:hypothetical protein